MRKTNGTIKGVLNTVGRVAKGSCRIILPILGTMLVNGTVNNTFDKIRYCGHVGYDDAVEAIMSSDMYSSSKRDAVALLKRGENEEYYRAVIHTVLSDMYSSSKIDILRNMSETSE